MDRLFDTYAELLPPHAATSSATGSPRTPSDSDFVYRQAIRAKAFDALRGILPAASLSNVGIYGTGQGYEQLLLRMRAHPLPEARAYADLMLNELRKVIPSFLKRVDLDDRGVAWSAYLESTAARPWTTVAERLFPATTPVDPAPLVRLVDFDPDAEVKLVAAMLYPHLPLPEDQIERRVRAMSVDDRLAVMRAYVGERTNRRHKPGRALERIGLPLRRGGRLRRLPRPATPPDAHHRVAARSPPTSASPGPRRSTPPARRPRSTTPWSARPSSTRPWSSASRPRRPTPCRWPTRCGSCMQMNAREAMHLLELRTTPQGHPAYRLVGQEMHRLIAEEAGHHAVAEMMRYVDHPPEPALERLDAERRAEARRQGG